MSLDSLWPFFLKLWELSHCQGFHGPWMVEITTFTFLRLTLFPTEDQISSYSPILPFTKFHII